MKVKSYLKLCSGIVVLLFLTAEVTNASSLANTAWPVYRQNLSNTAQAIKGKGGSVPYPIGGFSTDSYVSATPVIGVDNNIYFGSQSGKFYAFSYDGTLQWIYRTGNSISSTAAIDSDGIIYFGSRDRKIYALNPDGSLKWEYNTGSLIYSSPVIGPDGVIYIGSGNGKFYALNPDGTLKWQFVPSQNYGAIYSTAAISQNSIYFGHGNYYFYALNLDGTLKWQYQTGGKIYSSPAVASDGTIYFGSEDSYIYALNSNGTLKWKYKTAAAVRASAAIGPDGTIYIGSQDKKLYAINPNGTLKWTFITGDVIEASPTIDAAGIIYIGSYDKYVYAIHPNGTLKWKYNIGTAVGSSVTISANGALYIGGKNKMIAFKSEDIIPPQVKSVEVINRNTQIKIIFSEEMNRASCEAGFTLDNVSGTFSWNIISDTMIFTPDNKLIEGATYQIKLTAGCKDLVGNTLDGDKDGIAEGEPTDDYVEFIKIPDITPPQVIATSPTNSETNVKVNSTINITFSEAMDKQACESAFSINPPIPGQSTTSNKSSMGKIGEPRLPPTLSTLGQFTWLDNKLTYTPPNDLASNTTYEVKLTTSCKDLSNNGLPTDYIFSFTTEDITPPVLSNLQQLPSDLNEETNASLVIKINAFDNGGLQSVQIKYKRGNYDTDWTQYENMIKDADNIYSFTIPSPPNGWRTITKQYVEYTIKAIDLAGNETIISNKEFIEAVPVTQWLHPDDLPPVSYQEWKEDQIPVPFEMNKVYETLKKSEDEKSEFKLTPPPSAPSPTLPSFYILINSSIYSNLQVSIEQYVKAVEQLGYNAVVYSGTIDTPQNMRLFLQDAYNTNNLKGCIIIGNFPVAWYEMDNPLPWGHEEFPIDLYYMDLDGVFSDADNDGIYDSHSGNKSPEIFIGRLSASTLTLGGKTEVDLLINYFNKLNNYRTYQFLLPHRALLYVDDDWEYWADSWTNDLKQVYRDTTTIKDKATTRASDYKLRLNDKYEFIQLHAHSYSGGHHFELPNNADGGWVFSQDVYNLNPDTLFYNLFACSAARYVENNYIGGWYTFTSTYGLAAIGSTKIGAMLQFNKFYNSLSQNITFGEAFKQWFNEVGLTDPKWFYGLTLLGDPLLKVSTTTAPTSYVEALPTLSPTTFTVKWTGKSNSHTNIKYYDVQYKDGAGGEWVNWLTETTSTSAQFSGLEAHTYYFQVRAVDYAGNQEAYPNGDGDTHTTIITSLPVIISTSPSGNNVSTSSVIQVEFSEEVNQTACENAFTITPSINGSFSWNSNTLTFTPNPHLNYETQYNVTITTQCKDLAGNTLDGNKNGIAEGSPVDDYKFTFKTEPQPLTPGTCTVTTGADSGAGSLRECIIWANTNPGVDTINFSLSTTITPLTQLPALSDSTGGTIIDGTGQNIIIDGNGGAFHGFEITSPNNQINSLTIRNFGQDGIYVSVATADYNKISQNNIYNNGGLGINLTAGANEDINPPVITKVIHTGGNVFNIDGTAVANSTIELFRVDDTAIGVTPDPSGYGEAYLYLTSTTADATGNWSIASITITGGEYITTTATDSNNNTSEFSLNWKLDTTPPQVSTTSPYDSATNVSISTTIEIVFSEAMDPATCIDSAFVINPSTSGTFSWSAGNTKLTFTPTSYLTGDQTYTVTLIADDGVNKCRDVAGNTLDGNKNGTADGSPMDNYSFSFTTGIPPQITSTFPANGTLDVGVTTDIQITFSEAMNQVSCEASFLISPATAGAFSWIGNTMTFNPTSDLLYDTTYTVKMTTGCKDLAGNTLDGDKDGVAEPSPTDDYSFWFVTEKQLQCADWVVKTTADSGIGSLRACIEEANTTAGAEIITFDNSIAGGTITLLSQLPSLRDTTGGITIDGTGKNITIDGGGKGFDGFYVKSSTNTIIGLTIIKFGKYGIKIEGTAAFNNTIVDNKIGTDGTVAKGNGYGVGIINAPNNIIRDNIISGNRYYAIHLVGNDTTGTQIKGNKIGTNADGTSAIGNGWGIINDSADNNIIGGATASERNIISGNAAYGILLANGANSNQVIGNYIGTDVTGSVSIPNGNVGIYIYNGSVDNIIGGATASDRNIISNNGNWGVNIYNNSHNNQVINNYIGVDVTGSVNMGNASGGVQVYVSSGNIIQQNTINYNKGEGILLNQSSGGSISSNTIRNNTKTGIHNILSNTPISSNTISNNGGQGIYNLGSSPQISNNEITNNTAEGIRNEVEFGDNTYSDTYSDDTFSNPSITGNKINSNGAGISIYSIDNQPRLDFTSLNTNNTLGDTTKVRHDYFGFVWVIDGTGNPVSGANVAIYDKDNVKIATGTTDTYGYYPSQTQLHKVDAKKSIQIKSYVDDISQGPHRIDVSYDGTTCWQYFTYDGDSSDLNGNDMATPDGRFQIAVLCDYIDNIPPQVSSYSPVGGALKPSEINEIKVVFNERMNPDTCQAAFKTTPPSPALPSGSFSWTWDGTNHTLTRTLAKKLSELTTYKITIEGTCTDLFGNYLNGNKDNPPPDDDFSWEFTTTDETPPQIVSTNPANKQKDVLTSTTITINFSEPVDTAACEAAFQTTPAISGTFKWYNTDKQMVLTPSTDLIGKTTYQITITTECKDKIGNTLTNDYSFTFTTSAGGSELADTPWPIYRHDLLNTANTKTAAGWTHPAPLWSYNFGDYVVATPIIGVDNSIYLGSRNGKFYALTFDGELKWVFQTNNIITSSAAVAANGIIYFGSYDYNIYALNPNGTLRWTYPTNYKVQASPIIGPDGGVYVGSGDGYFYALNPDGTLKWKSRPDSGAITSTAAISENIVYFGNVFGYFYALNIVDGTVVWKYLAGGKIHSSPAISPDGTTIYFGSYDTYIYALNSTDGKLKWKYKTAKEIFSSPAIASDGTIYIGSLDTYLYALNPDGTLKWKFKTAAEILASPTIDSAGTIYFTSYDGYLYAISPDGTERWRYKVENVSNNSSPIIIPIGALYVSGNKVTLLGPGLPPQVKSVSPPNGSTEVAINTKIIIEFSKSMRTDAASAVSISPVVSWSAAWSANNTILTFTPKILQYNTKYTVTITADKCKDLGGKTLDGNKNYNEDGSPEDDVSWQFTTILCDLANTPWPTFRHDLKGTGRSPNPATATAVEKWNFFTEAGVHWSTPVIDCDGNIYINSWDWNVYKIKPDGTQVWKFSTTNRMDMSPVVTDCKRIYAGSDNGNLYAIDIEKGTQIWVLPLTSGVKIEAAPIVAPDGTIYIGSYDTYFYSISAQGNINWKYKTDGEIFTTAALAADGTIYFGSADGNFYALNPNGTLKWKYNVGAGLFSSPAVGTDGTIYFGAGNGFYALNSDGTLKWSRTDVGEIRSSPAIASDGTIYVGSHDYNLYAFNPSDGSNKFVPVTLNNKIDSSPTIDSDGVIYIATHSHTLYAINPTGVIKWDYNIPAGAQPLQYASPIIASDGTIYIGSSNGRLYALHNTPPTITPPASSTIVTITHPTTGEQLTAGTYYDITWQIDNSTSVNKIELYYSSSAGNNWTEIISFTRPTFILPDNLSPDEEKTLQIEFLSNNNKLPSSYTWTVPKEATTSAMIKIILKDNNENIIAQATTNSTFTITIINNPPVLTQIPNQQVNEGELLQFIVTATDLDNEKLILKAENLPEGVEFKFINYQSSVTSYQFSWQPTWQQGSKEYQIKFIAEDSYSATDTQIVTITVIDKILFEQQIIASQSATITASDGTKVTIPANTLSKDTTLIISLPTNIPTGKFLPAAQIEGQELQTDVIREFKFTENDVKINGFIELTLSYKNVNIPPNYSEDNLRIYHFNESAGEWQIVEGNQIVDKLAKTITCYVTHFSLYGIFLLPSHISELIYGTCYIYPNPVNPQKLNPTLHYNLSKDADVKIRIFAKSGRLIKTINIPRYTDGATVGKNKLRINPEPDFLTQPLPNGLYFIILEANDGKRTSRKIIKMLIWK